MPEDYWTKMFRYVLGSGVMAVNFDDGLNELNITAPSSGMTVNMDSGAAWIQGHYYENDASGVAIGPLAPAEGSTRYDLIVLQCKWGPNAQIMAAIHKGTAGAAAPTPTQQYGVLWELPLAQVTVAPGTTSISATMITDSRKFVGASTAKSSTYVVAADTASALIRANADAIIPVGDIYAQTTINTAINEVFGYGGGTVQLSEGMFNLSNSITPKQGVDLAGLGNRTVLKCLASQTTPAILATSVNDLTIKNLAIDMSGPAIINGTMPTQTQGEGVRIVEGKNVTLDNLLIHHCGATGVALASIDSTAVNAYGHMVRGCSINNCMHGIWIQSNSGLFSNNMIYNCGYGIIVDGAGSWGASINEITGNSIRNISKYGILMNGGTASDSPTTKNCSQNLVSGNIISNCNMGNATTVAFAGILLEGGGCQYNCVTGNSVQAWTGVKPQYGIGCDQCSKNSIFCNHVINACGAGGANIKQTWAAGGITTNNPNIIHSNYSGGTTADSGGNYDWAGPY
jgi:hypothetical protein